MPHHTPKMMPLADWAAARYSRPPSMYVLRKLCRNGSFDPPAEKTGRDWFVREDAKLISANDDAPPAAANDQESQPRPRLSLVEQLRQAGI